MNQTKGKISVAISIIRALSDIERQCLENGVTNSFTWFAFSTRLRAYIGDIYSPSDEMIKTRMRKIQAHGYLNRKDGTRTFIAYQRGNNGVYRFSIADDTLVKAILFGKDGHGNLYTFDVKCVVKHIKL